MTARQGEKRATGRGHERHSNLQRKLTMFSSRSLIRGSLVILEWSHRVAFRFNFAFRLRYVDREG